MARRRWYRRYPRVVAAKKKWATNIVTNTLYTQGSTTSGKTSNAVPLVENTPQSATPTPSILKCGNFKVQGDCMFGDAGTTIVIPPGIQVVLYVLYIPEGLSLTSLDLIVERHPEWIMGWKVIDATAGSSALANSTTFSFSTRLKRNLNSGDRVVELASAELPAVASITFQPIIHSG